MNAFEVDRPTLHEIAIHEAAHGGDRSLGCSAATFRSGRRRLKIASTVRHKTRQAMVAFGGGADITNWSGLVRFLVEFEERRGSLGHLATLRFLSPLIEPDRQISRIRLSDKTSRLCCCVRRHLQFLNTHRSL